MPNLDYWHCFHDGTIIAASGSLPGDIELTIDCDCIREELHQNPGMFLLRITNCTLFEIAPYETDLALDGFEALESGEFEILDASIEMGVVEVSNATGIMRLCYESEMLTLDDGTAISLRDLINAANRSVGDF
jgi:hypothetical protein